MHAPVLQIADLDKGFVVCTHACKKGHSGVLMKDRLVVCYESRKMNENKKNYHTHDLELEAIIHTLNMWRHYILGRRFILMSDHSGFWYLFDQLNLNSRQTQWLAMVTKFNFQIGYIKGKENRVVNALSRWIQINQLEAMSSYVRDI